MKKMIAALFLAVPLTFAAQTPAPAAPATHNTVAVQKPAPVAKKKLVKKTRLIKKTAAVKNHKRTAKIHKVSAKKHTATNPVKKG